METALLTTSSKSNLKLLLDIANRLGIKTSKITDEQLEEMGLIEAIKKGRTGKYVNEETFMKNLKKRIG